MVNKNMWEAIANIAGVITTIVALITVYISIISLQKEKYFNRPYFVIKEPGIRPLQVSPPYRIIITLYNTGNHPAIDLTGSIKILDQSMNKLPQFNFMFSVANEITKDLPTPWYNDGLLLQNNVDPQFIVLDVKYYDPILEENYHQRFYMKWSGVKNGITEPDFVHVNIDERNKIENYIKDYKIIF